jgi:hypothetical protein
MLPVREQDKEEISMANNRTSYRNILTRSLAMIALLCIYCFSMIGASALLLGGSSTAALARGGGGGGGHGGGGGGGRGGGGFRGGGFRGGGFGLGLGLGLYGPYGYGYGYPYGYGGYYDDEGGCYLVRRRVMTPRGWRIRRVQVCE